MDIVADWGPSGVHDLAITGDRGKYNQILLVKIGEYAGFCEFRRSY